MDALRQALFIAVASIISGIALAAFTDHVEEAGQVPFTYSGAKGPDRWGSLSPKFSMCSDGKSQSPIDILTKEVAVMEERNPLLSSYAGVVENVTLINSFYSVGVKYPHSSGRLIVDDSIYNLVQMHWHTPSEHKINGRRFAAELHLVHIDENGRIAVVGMLYKLGRSNKLIAKMQHKFIELANKSILHEKMEPPEVMKGCPKYYKYRGSLTIPPCKENVTWFIMGSLTTISPKQLHILRIPLKVGCKNNARPCQPLNRRRVDLLVRK